MAKEFRVHRSIDIAAPPERILPLLTDLRAWQKWSPWEGLDPALERTYAGAESGVGAVYGWRGNSKAGQGRMEIVETAEDRVGIDLLFAAPMKAHNRVDFELTPSEAGTRVSWVMTGPQNLVMRLMSKVYSMEKMIAPDLEKGLRQLKQVVESS
ncbi:SRPBCC family protein [Intrasporangium sp.]|uniref:SRPBCC family protein n=1 Tax=Intrasporangium sp. TaxID=1925024 RepID=UPI002939E1FE|nr:SRPBCC family protein [Intrasporangium sp.]MDV3220358.1 SRPBCC family protein [Intrasporangium sp.]